MLLKKNIYVLHFALLILPLYGAAQDEIQDKSAGIPDRVSIIEGEQAVQNDRLAALEAAAGSDCTIGSFVGGSWLVDSDGNKTSYQFIWWFEPGTGYVVNAVTGYLGFVDFASDSKSTLPVAGDGVNIGAFIGSCRTPPLNSGDHTQIGGLKASEIYQYYRELFEARRYAHKLTITDGLCRTETHDGKTVEWNCAEVE